MKLHPGIKRNRSGRDTPLFTGCTWAVCLFTCIQTQAAIGANKATTSQQTMFGHGVSVSESSESERAQSVALSGASRAAAAKLDSRLVFALASPDGRIFANRPSLEDVGVASVLDVEFSVIVRSDLTNGELEGLGLHVGSRVGPLVTGTIVGSNLEELAEHPAVSAVEGAYALEPSLDVSIPEIRANLVNAPVNGYTGEGVIVGFIDDGLDLTHEDFLDEEGNTRVLFAWDQFRNGTPPDGFTYGTEHSSEDIDAGNAMQFRNDGGHGSHVAGIAVGDGSSVPGSPYRGVAWRSDILVVVNGGCDLFCYGGGTGFYGPPSTVGSIDGLVYMLDKAQEAGRPLVVNQSQSVSMGPHDGTTLFEQAYDLLVAQENLILCAPAGNDQTRASHGVVNVAENGSGRIFVDYDETVESRTEFFCDIWYDAGNEFSLTVGTPGGSPIDIPASTGGVPTLAETPAGDWVVFYSTPSHPANQQGNIGVWIRNPDTPEPLHEPGTWTFLIQSHEGSGEAHLYCERDQAGVTVQDPELGGNITMPGTASGVITVSSYNSRFSWPSVQGETSIPDSNPIGDATSFSSWGPRRDDAPKPDIAAPGYWVLSSLSKDSPIDPHFVEREGRHVALGGTSMATPHVAGTIALMLQRHPGLRSEEIKALLQDTARQDDFTGGLPFDPAFGAGKLDAAAAVLGVRAPATCANCLTELPGGKEDVRALAADSPAASLLTSEMAVGVHPNPTHGVTRVHYDLPFSGEVDVQVFDASGRRIRSLFDGWQMAGGHILPWNGRNDAGDHVPSGVYLVRISTPSGSEISRVTIAR